MKQAFTGEDFKTMLSCLVAVIQEAEVVGVKSIQEV